MFRVNLPRLEAALAMQPQDAVLTTAGVKFFLMMTEHHHCHRRE
jgi:hypothetical protein